MGPAAVISVVTDYQTTELTIHDMAGRIIHSQPVISGEYTWDCSRVPPGMYMVRVTGGDSTAGFKLVHVK